MGPECFLPAMIGGRVRGRRDGGGRGGGRRRGLWGLRNIGGELLMYRS